MRPDYCPMVNEPCQSMCDTQCSVNRLKAQRTWVGLTIEDKKEYIAQDFGGSRTDAMDWTEKRLMEKNT